MSPRLLANGLFSGAIVVVVLLFARQIFTPDAGASYFARAQQLESSGLIPLALKHYRLLSENHPESVFAPRALLREGDLLAAQGRQNGDETLLHQAVTAYARLAKDYSSDPLANEALFDAGQISAENLHDPNGARQFYNQLLDSNSPNSDATAMATLKLGRLALSEGDGKTAQDLLQKVLQRWPRNALVGAEAQFHLGVVYETLLKNSKSAMRAYDATVAHYPTSTWANTARERMGLIYFTSSLGHPPARRVMLDVEPLPDDDGLSSGTPNSPWNALRPLLAARGLAVSDLTLSGWGLKPFWAGLDTTNPARVVSPSFDAFGNVVANAGLRFTVKSGGPESDALRDLQNDIDAGELALVYFAENGNARWTLCVGYDSERGEVYLQDRGAQYDTLNTKAFAQGWKAKSSFNKPYTLLSFVATSAKANVKPNLTPTPLPSPTAGQTPVPALEAPPTFVVRLPKLSRADAHRRTLRRAAVTLGRNGNGQVLLGPAALDWLANELEKVAKAPISAPPTEMPTPARQLNPEETPTADPTPTLGGEENALEEPTPTLEPTTPPTSPYEGVAARRAVQLLRFFGAPARQWIALRRQGASYCDLVARQTNNSNLSQAAQSLTQSADALEAASGSVPAIGEALTEADRETLGAIVRQLRRARDAERQAARLME